VGLCAGIRWIGLDWVCKLVGRGGLGEQNTT